MRERVDLKSPVRENRPPGSVRGAPGDRRPLKIGHSGWTLGAGSRKTSGQWNRSASRAARSQAMI